MFTNDNNNNSEKQPQNGVPADHMLVAQEELVSVPERSIAAPDNYLLINFDGDLYGEEEIIPYELDLTQVSEASSSSESDTSDSEISTPVRTKESLTRLCIRECSWGFIALAILLAIIVLAAYLNRLLIQYILPI